MEKRFVFLPAAAGYGSRIYVNSNDSWATQYLKEWCKWGNYDKKMIEDEGEQTLLGYEFSKEVENWVLCSLRLLNYQQLSADETAELFRHYHVY